MNNDFINELRKKLDIVNVISNYISLEKKGRNYFGICPFHDDHNPSLSVSPEKQIYTCFVCKASGNVFNFVMDYEHVSFNEAVKTLADSIGMDYQYKKTKSDKYDRYYEALEIASSVYQNNLMSKEGEKAREYLKKRVLDDDTIKEFGIGVSLNKFDSITNILVNKGYSLEELNTLDLSNTNHDSFINRIMFPLHNINGKVIGFSGRIYDNSDLNKYQNSKESIIFKKRENLFNYHRAKEAIRTNKSVIVMEGFMAVIRAYTIGIKNCVATMGTALSHEQANLIKKLSPNIYLCLDGDNAGQQATLKNGEEFLKLGVIPKVIQLSNNLDPDDYILKNGADAFKNLIENAIGFNEFKIKVVRNNYDLNNVDDKTKYINDVLLQISQESDEIKREIMLKNLESETNVWYNTLEKKLFSLMDKKINEQKKELKVVKHDSRDGLNRAVYSLIYYMLIYPKAITLVDSSNVFIPDKNNRLLIREIVDYYQRYGAISIADFYTYIMKEEELFKNLKLILSFDYPDVSDTVVSENIKAINNYNIASEIKKLENLIKDESDINEQIKLMDKIRNLKLKEGK